MFGKYTYNGATTSPYWTNAKQYVAVGFGASGVTFIADNTWPLTVDVTAPGGDWTLDSITEGGVTQLYP